MDRIWTPWRYNYVSKAEPSSGCIFCEKAQPGNDEENLVLHRGELNYILLNLYPYNNGHVMIAPYEHVATLEGVSVATAEEMMRLVRRTEQVIRKVYRPQGVNLGMNIGECAGAGVAGHIHMHVLPRWFGDGGFMASIGETRIIPEDLTTTWKKLLEVFGD